MAGIEQRLTKLENVAVTLPPDGAYLLHQISLLPESERDTWWKARTEAELEAMVLQDSRITCLDFDRLTEAELEQLCELNGAELDAFWAELRAMKPDYFTKGKQ
ncbi:MAG: hypothetical protein ACRD82_02355 [Blastocatellia bacterium]